MFIIIGGDGKEYGPVTTDQVRAWMTAGRANLDTRAKALGSEEWRRLGDYAEFAPPSDAPPMIGAQVAQPATPAPTPTGPVAAPADRGIRLVARLIDWVIEWACAIPGAIILGEEFLRIVVIVSQGREPDFEDLNVERLVLGGIVLAAAWLALLVVQVWMLTTRGQSIGKRIMGVRIVKLDGSSPGIVHAWVLRELLITAIGIMISLVPFVGPVFIRPVFHLVDWCLIFREDQRCLHDLIAGTRVVKV